MDLQKVGLQKIKDEVSVSPDGDIYRATEWRHESGAKVEVNIDLEPVRYHARINGKATSVNQDKSGLVAFLHRFFGRR